MTNKELWQFPCSIGLKVVGNQRVDFANDVVSAIQQHVVGDYSVRETPSSAGRYVSVTVMVYFENAELLQAVYQSLRNVAGVKLVL